MLEITNLKYDLFKVSNGSNVLYLVFFTTNYFGTAVDFIKVIENICWIYYNTV